MSNPSDQTRTPPPAKPSATAVAASGPPLWAAALALATVILLVYGRGLHVPFVFDDNESVVTNKSIRSLWPLIGTEEHRGPLNPVRDLPTTARPVVNYLFALNYRFGGLGLAGYHLTNFFIHFLTAMLLMAVVRRTLLLPYFAGKLDGAAGWLAFIIALLWSVHPLLTDGVIYITQRTELMMALFYLATLYCSLRYWSCFPLPSGPTSSQSQLIESASAKPYPNSRHALWLVLAILACLGGMLSKEVMISAPIVVFLFDRTFVSGTFASTLKRSSRLYLGLALTWIPLFVLSAYSPRSKSSGFHLCQTFSNVLVYWLTQCKVLLMYLKLAIWPWPLRCAYELPHVDTVASFMLYVVPVIALVCLALVLLKRNNPVGFIFFFVGAILAPTSIMPILTEMAAERRMYLPLAALISLVVVSVYIFAKRQLTQSIAKGEAATDSQLLKRAGIGSVVVVTLLYGLVSAHRVSDYYNETLMWQQVAESQPLNYMAHYNLGLIYNAAGREADSLKELQISVDAHPRYPASRSALGFALMKAGHIPEALASIQTALEINPDYVPALNNLGIALTQMGRFNEAITCLERAIKLDPSHADAHNNLAEALLKVGRTTEANEQLKISQALSPDDADTLYNMATAHANNNELPQAIELYKRAVEQRPKFAKAHNDLGIALHRSGDARGAVEHWKIFQQLQPNDPGAYCNLALAAAGAGNVQLAAENYKKAATLVPDAPEPHFMLGSGFAQIGALSEAITHFQKALQLNPNLLQVYPALADALAKANRGNEALEVAQRGLQATKAAGDQATAQQLQDWLARAQAGATKQ